jgi:hypothetical protein
MRPRDDEQRPVEGDERASDVGPTNADVGSEGGSPGDIELVKKPATGVGSEADETWRPADEEVAPIARDETGAGRRSP